MRRFTLRRTEDISGISGVGDVAEGVVFHDGQVAMSWFGRYHTLEISPNIETTLAIHGHGGRTEVVYHEGDEE